MQDDNPNTTEFTPRRSGRERRAVHNESGSSPLPTQEGLIIPHERASVDPISSCRRLFSHIEWFNPAH